MKFCPQCGNMLDDGMRYCQVCGFDRSTVEPFEAPLSKAPVEEPAEEPEDEVVPAPEAEPGPVCPGCGLPVVPGDVFCQGCGYNLAAPAQEPIPQQSVVAPEPAPEPAEETKPSCPRCGAAWVPGDRFCQECGFDAEAPLKPAEEEAPAPQTVPLAEPVKAAPVFAEEEPGPAQPAGPVCPQCGTPYTPGDRFCETCGYNLSAAAQPAAPPPVQAAPPPAAPPPPAQKPAVSFAELPGAPPPARKKGKAWLWILVAVVGISILGAGGWFGYNKFVKNKPAEEPAADTTVLVQETVSTPADTALTKQPADTAAPEKAPGSPVLTPPAQAEKPKEKTTAKTATSPKQPQGQKSPTTPPAQQQQAPPAQNQVRPDLGIKTQKTETQGTAREVKVLYKMGDNDKPKNKGVKNPVSFSLSKASVITRITTDHYNGGTGVSSPGYIILKSKAGNIIGSYKAYGKSTGDASNAKWVVEPKVEVPAGSYLIEDSDMPTWSKTLIGSYGFVVIEGYNL